MGWGEQQQARAVAALAAADRLASACADMERHPSTSNVESVHHHAAEYREARARPSQ